MCTEQQQQRFYFVVIEKQQQQFATTTTATTEQQHQQPRPPPYPYQGSALYLRTGATSRLHPALVLQPTTIHRSDNCCRPLHSKLQFSTNPACNNWVLFQFLFKPITRAVTVRAIDLIIANLWIDYT